MDTKIPCLDLKRQHLIIKDEIFSIFEKVYNDTAFSGGSYVADFENKFATFIESNYAIGVSNGTVALHLAMLVLGIGKGDEVILPANTFIATAWGVSHAGATPVFVDCDETWNIDASKIEKLITNRTKAVIGVHLYGQPFDVDAVSELCKKYSLFLIEDSSQAHGAKYKNKRIGALADLGTFSFYPGKNLGACGEAGGLTTNSLEYANHLQSLRNHGSKSKYVHDEIGFNYRMGGLEGASLGVKLKYIDSWNNRRKEIASIYKNQITNNKIKMQHTPEWADGVFHLFVITTEDRESLIKHLESNNINPGFHYPIPCHLQNAYKDLNYQIGDFPISEYLADHCISLPMFPELTNKEVDYVINTINNF